MTLAARPPSFSAAPWLSSVLVVLESWALDPDVGASLDLTPLSHVADDPHADRMTRLASTLVAQVVDVDRVSMDVSAATTAAFQRLDRIATECLADLQANPHLAASTRTELNFIADAVVEELEKRGGPAIHVLPLFLSFPLGWKGLEWKEWGLRERGPVCDILGRLWSRHRTDVEASLNVWARLAHSVSLRDPFPETDKGWALWIRAACPDPATFGLRPAPLPPLLLSWEDWASSPLLSVIADTWKECPEAMRQKLEQPDIRDAIETVRFSFPQATAPLAALLDAHVLQNTLTATDLKPRRPRL